MSKLIDINISDNMFKEMLNALKKDVNEKTALIDAEIGAYGELMATSAKNIVSGNAIDTGRLASSISLKKEQFLSYNLVAQTDYAAYVEFGTGKYHAGSYVPTLEKEWQNIAKSFLKSGNGHLPSRPYMRPSILAYQKPLKEAIIKILNK
jgi:hypothetical protein